MSSGKFAVANKVVVITGGARGIGAATGKAFAAAGAIVALGDLDGDLSRATALEIGGTTHGFELDVTSLANFELFLDLVEQNLGPIDVLVNNAGIMPVTEFADETVESIQRQIDINLRGVIWGSQQAIRRMTPAGSGHVVNIASAAGKFGFPGVATYCATKHAVVGLSDALSLELKGTGISISCVMPGLVRTQLTDGLEEHWLLKTCEPEEIAAAIVRAVTKRRHDVFLPKRLSFMNRTKTLLPRPVGTWAMRVLGADHQILDGAHNSERAEYENRAAGDNRENVTD